MRQEPSPLNLILSLKYCIKFTYFISILLAYLLLNLILSSYTLSFASNDEFSGSIPAPNDVPLLIKPMGFEKTERIHETGA